MFHILTSSRAERGDRRILRLLHRFTPRKDGKTAFTLAEILITLLIIGVVASIVLPAIIQDTQEAEYKTAYKKAFADASAALRFAVADYSLVSRASDDDGENNWINFNAFKSKLAVNKDCGNNNSACWGTGESWRAGTPTNDAPSFIDNSGRSWSMRGIWTTPTWILSYLFVDTNGLKSPNKYGKDRFVMIMSNNNNKPVDPAVDGWVSIRSISTGMPVVIVPFPDVINNSLDNCPSGNCFNTTWLK